MLLSFFCKLFIKFPFILNDNIRSGCIIRFQNKRIRQAIEINLVKGFPNAKKRDQIFRPDLLFNPFPLIIKFMITYCGTIYAY